MHLSHSGLQQILSCPASYYLTKEQGISKKKLSAALDIGSAFHWGCEHNTEDLSGYLDEQDPYIQQAYDFDKDIALATGMVHGYFKQKPIIFDQILTGYNGEKLEILDEQHELDLLVNLPSKRYENPHEFHGIIDLLLLTEKGFIILDYKTSTKKPDFDKYLDQILRYCWMIKKTFPEMPIYKIGIINVRKVSLKQKEKEARDNFIMRIKREYEVNPDELIEYHEFSPDDFEESKMNLYIDNLSRMCDFAQDISDNHRWFINYGNAVSEYGKSEFWEYFYKIPEAHHLYKIRDPMWNEEFNQVTEYRDCRPIDMEALDNVVLNHYKDFEKLLNNCLESSKTDSYKKDLINIFGEDRVNEDYDACVLEDFENGLRKAFIIDEELLDYYWKEYTRVATESSDEVEISA